jgi:hypothetical protein
LSHTSIGPNRGLVLFLLLLSVILPSSLMVPAPTFAQSNAATVHPDPTKLEVGQGQVETLNIVIDNAQDVYGIDVRGKFDPNVIEIADADPSTDGVQMIPGDFIKPDFLVRNTADNKKGTFQYVITEVNPTPPAQGSGVVLSILIRGKALGKQSSFTIDFVQIADRHGKKLSVSSQNGSVVVVTPKPPTATPTGNATPTLAATATITPAQTIAPTRTAVTRTPIPVRAVQQTGNSFLLNAILILVAGGTCLGTIVLLAFAAFLLLRRRPPPPVSDPPRWS